MTNASTTVRSVSAAPRTRHNVGPAGSDMVGHTRAVMQKHARQFPQQAMIGVWMERNATPRAFRSGARALEAWLGVQPGCDCTKVTRVN